MFPESAYTFINHKTIPGAMKLSQAYELAIKTGIKHDPRSKEEIDRVLKEAKDAREEAKKAKGTSMRKGSGTPMLIPDSRGETGMRRSAGYYGA